MELFRSIICISVLTVISFLAFKDVLITHINNHHTTPSISEINPSVSRTFSLLVDPAQPAYSWAGKQTTSKGGFLWVHYNDTHTRSWEVSMLHALHCLHIVRRIVEGKGSKVHEKGGGIPKHVIHCMDYIAQSLLCSGDDTIEPSATTWDEFGNIIEKADFEVDSFKHTCKDTSFLWDVVEKSETKPLPKWDWKMGDSIQSVFRK